MKQCSLVLVIKGKVPDSRSGSLTRSERHSATTAEMSAEQRRASFLQSHALTSSMMMEVKVTGEQYEVINMLLAGHHNPEAGASALPCRDALEEY